MVFETIKEALITQLDIDAEDISEEALVNKDLELDSTETVIIALEIKKKYGVDYEFGDDDISLGDICKEVESMIAESEPA